ncbi:caspase family protein [Ruegeria arenilitoris]|uniref:caspase family protein n=2 Tax=Ruegeria arenilitoris TaxID=1173585 RepID=UPI00147C391F|nr:caspase family protein [Ruegeria arenilitoris]
MFRYVSTWLAASFCVFIASDVVAEETRVALVIGNSDYDHVANLPNPENDAQDIAAALKRLDFEVTVGTNLDYREMRLALRDFADASRTADKVMIYYAGHGIEIENNNYLIPINAELRSDIDVDFEAIRLDTVVNSIAQSPGLKIVLVDACRNNPFVTDMIRTSSTRSIGQGLARIDPGGVLVGYSARGGTLALDGDGRNSPYASALLTHLEEPGLEVGKMFRKVRDSVFQATEGYQEPFTYGSLPGSDLFLKEPLPPDPKKQMSEAEIAMAAAQINNELASDYTQAESRGTVYSWKKFLEKYEAHSEHYLVAFAKDKLEVLQSEAEAKRRKRNREPWLKASFPDGKLEADLTLEQRKLVQEALNMMGQNVGSVDGAFGPRTRNAISTVRVANGLYPGTRVDIAFLRLLPDVPAIKALQSDTARAYKQEEMPEAMEERLQRALKILGRSEVVFGYFEGHLYLAVRSSRKDFFTSSEFANEMGGHLATIGNARENQFIYNLIKNDKRYFRKGSSGNIQGPAFGLYQLPGSNEPSGGWVWITGEPLTYTRWSKGEPNNYKGNEGYAHFFGVPEHTRDPNYWNDGRGSHTAFIVEIE